MATSRISRRRLKVVALLVAFLAAGALGSWAAVQLFSTVEVPDVEQLEDYRASTITRLYSSHDQVFGEYAEERRIPITWDQIPQDLTNAMVAVEDAEFFEHGGVSLRGIARAAVLNLRSGRMRQGGSSITQQLAKVLFLTPERSLSRKAREALLAVNIERRYSKEEIFTLYCNQIYLGHGRYGVEAASRFYFGKSVGEVTLAEAALLAGLPQRPEGHSPLNDPAAALARRRHVLGRMVAEGFIAADQAAAAADSPLGVVTAPVAESSDPGYFQEEVRRFAEHRFGSRALYHDGLDIHTTLDESLQAASEQALKRGLAALDARQGRDGGPRAVDAPEAALIAIDIRTGAIRAMVGGSNFKKSRFNRAMQARRQAGSAFKPILYATALASGVTAADVLFDQPISLTDETTGVSYEPLNHGHRYNGLTTVRAALEQSLNPLAVQMYGKVGGDAVIATARSLGVQSRLEPYPSLALGAFEVSLIEMTAAFAAFADHGRYHVPYLVERVSDREGAEIYRRDPMPRQAIDEDVAFVVTRLLMGVIERGTGRRAGHIGVPLAGKTGTTDDYTDAWFIGYSPSLAIGVWAGYDHKRSLGVGEEGSRVALPIWMEAMEAHIGKAGREEFEVPPGIEFARIDRQSGRLAGEVCDDVLTEAFVHGTAPVEYCMPSDHEIMALPWQLQKVYLGDHPSIQFRNTQTN